MFSCEFCEISHNTFFKESFGRLLLHKHSFCLLSNHNLLFFQKRCHTYFPAEYFLSLIYRLKLFKRLARRLQPSQTSAAELFFRKQLTG